MKLLREGKLPKIRQIKARTTEQVTGKSPQWFAYRTERLKLLMARFKKMRKSPQKKKLLVKIREFRKILKHYRPWARKLRAERCRVTMTRLRPTKSVFQLHRYMKSIINLRRRLHGRQWKQYSPAQVAKFLQSFQDTKRRIDLTLKSDWFKTQNPLDFPPDTQALLREYISF